MGKVVTFASAFALGVLSIIAVAPLFGISIPQTIWGLCVGSISAIAGNLVAQSVEKIEIKQPKGFKAKIIYEGEEK